MMFKRAGLLAASCALVGGIHAAPSATGFYGAATIGGTYTQVNEYFRGKSDDKDSQSKLFDESKAGFCVGGRVGYGYEFPKGFYVGFQAVALYDTAKIKKDPTEASADLSISEKNKSHFKLNYELEAKPKFTYGAHLLLGGKVAPNVLAYAFVGFEATYTTIEQYVVCVGDGITGTSEASNSSNTENKETTTASTGKQVLCALNNKAPAKIDGQEVKDLKAGDKASITILRLASGVGVRYFLSSGVFLDGEVAVPVGFGQKLDEKYYNTKPTQTLNGYSFESIQSKGATLRVKSPVGVRIGVSVGYKF